MNEEQNLPGDEDLHDVYTAALEPQGGEEDEPGEPLDEGDLRDRDLQVRSEDGARPLEAEVPQSADDGLTSVAAPIYAPSFPGFSALPVAEQERLNELAVLNPAQAMYEIAQRVSQQQAMVNVVASYHLQEAQAKAPGFFRVHGPRVQEALAQMPAEVRGTRQGIENAMAYALILEGQQTGDMLNAIRRAATLVGEDREKAGAPTKSAAPKTPLPPGQRTPSPTVSRSPVAPARTGSGRANETVKVLMDLHGLSKAEAERAAGAM